MSIATSTPSRPSPGWLIGCFVVVAGLWVGCDPAPAGEACGADERRCQRGRGEVIEVCVDGAFVAGPSCGDGERCDDGRCVEEDEVCVPACDGRTCGGDGCGATCGDCSGDDVCNATGACVAVPDTCGDDVCAGAAGGEDCAVCPGDCGACCGDGVCNGIAFETCDTCAADCGACCGDGVCSAARGENCATCVDDCGCTAAGTCGADGTCACTPTCGTAECGDDGCGGACGACGVTETCSNGTCVPGQCVPTTCATTGAACGVIDDGCGDDVSCGDCVAPQTCGGGGTANQCGATCPEGCPTNSTCDGQGVCRVQEPLFIGFNVATRPVTGIVRVNGALIAPDGRCGTTLNRATTVVITRVDDATARLVESIPCAAPLSLSLHLAPGDYHVDVGEGGSNAPALLTRVAGVFTVPPGTSTLSATWDVASRPVTPTVRVNGAAVQQNADCGPRFTAAGTATITRADGGDSVTSLVPCSGAALESLQLAPGEYDVVVSGRASNLPFVDAPIAGGRFTVPSGTGPITATWDMASRPVTATVTVNGSLVQPGADCGPRFTAHTSVSVRRIGGASEVLSVPCASSSLTVNLAPGDYAIGIKDIAGTAPTIEARVPGTFTVPTGTSTLTTTWNVAARPVVGAVQVNGATLVQTNGTCGNFSNAAVVTLTRADDATLTGQVSVPCNGGAVASARLAPGDWIVHVEGLGSNAPQLPGRVTGVTTVASGSGTQNVTWNVASRRLSGTVRVNGSPMVARSTCTTTDGIVRLADGSGGAHLVRITCAGTFVAEVRLAPGTYTVDARTGGFSNLPDVFVRQATPLTVTAGTTVQAVVVDVGRRRIDGSILANAAPIIAESRCGEGSNSARAGSLVLSSAAHPEASRRVTFTCAGLLETPVVLAPGVWTVEVDGFASNLPSLQARVVTRLGIPSCGEVACTDDDPADPVDPPDPPVDPDDPLPGPPGELTELARWLSACQGGTSTPPSSANAANTGVARFTAVGVRESSADAYPSFVCGSFNAHSSRFWNNVENPDKAWQVEVVTRGHTDIRVSSGQVGTSSGPRNFELQVSVDGVTFTTVGPPIAVTTSSLDASGIAFQVPLGPIADNRSRVFIRWRRTDDAVAINGGAIGSTGASRIDGITIEGRPPLTP